MMPGDMLSGNRVPTVVFDFDPSLVAHRLEPHLDLGELSPRKALLTPGKGESHRWLPCGYLTDFIDLAVRQNFDQASTRPRLKLELPGRFVCKAEKAVWLPPGADFACEHLECTARRS